MKIDSHYWSDTDQTVLLMNLFEYLHFTLEEETTQYLRYSKERKHYIVIHTDSGYYYYSCAHPEEKLRASDSIASFCSGIVTRDDSSIWERITRKYEEYLASGLDTTPKHILAKVAYDFNHFEIIPTTMQGVGLMSLYQEALTIPALANTMAMDSEGHLLFPLYNDENVLCGYLCDTPMGVEPYTYSNHISGIWYTGIPKKTDQLILFSTPQEALAFYVQYQPQNTICMACTSINYTTNTIVTKFKKVTKAKKVWFSFTGNTPIQGYMMDLQQIAQMNALDFMLNSTDQYLRVVLRTPDTVVFSKFYRKVQAFNESIVTYYKKYNKTKSVYQDLVNKYSISIKQTEVGDIYCRVPIEASAIKFMICNYQKHFLPNTIGVLKPQEVNWYRDFTKNGKKKSTIDYKTLKIAV